MYLLLFILVYLCSYISIYLYIYKYRAWACSGRPAPSHSIPDAETPAGDDGSECPCSAGSEGRGGRWGTPTMALHRCGKEGTMENSDHGTTHDTRWRRRLGVPLQRGTTSP